MKRALVKKVCIVIDDSFDSSGGAQTSVIDQATYLLGRNIAVDVFCPDSPKAEQTYSFIHSVQRTSPYIKALSGYSQLAVRRKLIDRISNASYDIIHCQSDRSAFTVARTAAAKNRTPLVHTFHGLYDAAIDSNQAFKGLLVSQAAYYGIAYDTARSVNIPDTLLRTFPERRHTHRKVWQTLAAMATLSHCFTTPSQYFLDCIKLIEPNFADKGFLVANAIDPGPYKIAVSAAFRHNDPAIRLITVSRLDKTKRIDTLLHAMALLPSNVILTIVGDGPEEGRLRTLINMLKLRERVVFQGFCRREKVGELLRGSDVFLLTSNCEAQGVVLLEAATAGLPIIYCNKQLTIGVSRQNALLTTTIAADAFAEAVNYLSRHPLKARRMGKASLHIASQYSIERMGREFLRVYGHALENIRINHL